MRILALSAAFLALTACVAEDVVVVQPTPEIVAPLQPLNISDVDWSLTVLNNRLVGRIMVVDLSGGGISGDGPCEDVRGNYLGTGPIFVVETFIVPRLPNCARAGLQDEIAEAMLYSRSALIEDRVLRLRDAQGTVLMEFLPVGDAL